MRRPPPPLPLPIALVAALTLTGCAINDPLNTQTTPSPSSPNEITIPARSGPSRTAHAAATSTPTAAIERYARRYINWNHDTLAATQRYLAAIAVGEAASMQARAAARTPADYELRRSRIANRGRIVALAPIRPSRPGTYIVVTHERTTGTRMYNGLAPAYHVTIATVRRLPSGWAVSQWRPQI